MQRSPAIYLSNFNKQARAMSLLGALRHFFTLLSCAARISSFVGMLPLPTAQVLSLRVHSSLLCIQHHLLHHKSSRQEITLLSWVVITASFILKHTLYPPYYIYPHDYVVPLVVIALTPAGILH